MTTTQLTKTESKFVEVLLENEGNPVSSTELYKRVWSVTWEPGTNRIAVIVRRLRTKQYGIKCHRGVGYSYDPSYQPQTSYYPQRESAMSG